MLQTDYSAVDNASTVTNIYALLVLIVGIVSLITAMRCLAPGTVNRWVIIWLVIVMVFSLGTMDLIGLALYSVALVIYLARNKAVAAQQDTIRKAIQGRRQRHDGYSQYSKQHTETQRTVHDRQTHCNAR